MVKEHSRQVNELLTAKSMDHVLLYHCTRTKLLDTCCKYSYQIRKLENKGALIVLIWSYLVTSLFYYLATHVSEFNHRVRLHFIGCCFTLPFGGWLADVCLGRYIVIRWSMWITWTATVLATVSSVVAQMVNSYQHIHFICTAYNSFNWTWRILG